MTKLIIDVGNNWNGNKLFLLEHLEVAAECGADAAVLHYYPKELYRDKGQNEAVQKWHLGNYHPYATAALGEGRDKAAPLELIFAPYYYKQVPDLNPDAWFVSSFNINQSELLAEIAKSNKPVYVGTCAVPEPELDWALSILPAQNVTLMHTSAGSDPADLKLKRILDLYSQYFDQVSRVGYEVLNIPQSVLVASAVLFGAEVIKVNFSLEGGVDQDRSFGPQMLVNLRKTIDDFVAAQECGCVFPLPDAMARAKFLLSQEDGLRPAYDNEI